ncbi:hypothetical protein FPOAC2_07309 [Fusarium poae]|uniref:Fucose-specific lectin n=1 Tax=Fusarium poae TaxID=36050 RepID=A0A1B8B012_FUSPO|nr:hypothetical protein FPOA_06547 [Fusarium poae]
MAPITALIDKSVPGDKVIKLFYCTGKAQLGLALWSGTEDADPDDNIQVPQDIGDGQYITNPSHMTSVSLRDSEKVFALTTDNPFKVTNNDDRNLSEISPLYRVHDVVDVGHLTLTSCANDENAWVYFSRSFGNGRALFERQIGGWQVTQLTWTHDLWINSFACAWYDTETQQRKVIYEGSFLVEYTVGSGTPGAAIGTAGDMQRNSPLAVVFDSGTVYLYYCGRMIAGGIRRVMKVNGSWGIPQTVGTATIAQDSQLAVVRANGINHLFYVARDQDESKDDYFVHYLDKNP